MKNLIIFFLIPIATVGCVKNDTISPELLEQAAFDMLHLELKSLEALTTKNIIEGKYNFNKIKEIMKDDTALFQNPCNINTSEYKNTPGVNDYLEVMCQKLTLINKLKEKYEFLKDQKVNYFEKIHFIFRLKYPDDLTPEMINDLLLNRKNNKK